MLFNFLLGCGGCSTPLHTIGRRWICDLLTMCDGHGPCLSITQDFQAQDTSNFVFTPAFGSRQYLCTDCFHDISNCEHKQVINPDEDDTPAILTNKQSRITMTMYKTKLMQQSDQHLVPLTCCLLEAIQSLFQLPHSSTVVTQLTRLNKLHNIIQLAILECTFYIKKHCLQVLACKYHQHTPPCRIYRAPQAPESHECLNDEFDQNPTQHTSP